MGHLLLPYGSRRASGIMKEGWDNVQTVMASARQLAFGPEQALRIRSGLSASASLAGQTR